MPVFDFSSTPENENKQDPICTYTTFSSNEGSASVEKPILILDNSSEKWKHHVVGVFGNQSKRTNFEFKEEGSSAYADILQIDATLMCVSPEKTEVTAMRYTRSVRPHSAAVPSCRRRMDFYNS